MSNSYWLYKFSRSSYYDYYDTTYLNPADIGKPFDVNWLEINMRPTANDVYLNKFVKYTKPFKR